MLSVQQLTIKWEHLNDGQLTVSSGKLETGDIYVTVGWMNGTTRVPMSVRHYLSDKESLIFRMDVTILSTFFETNTHCCFSMKYRETGDIYSPNS